MALVLTERAAQEVRTIIDRRQDGIDEADRKPLYLRVGVKGGGCAGFSYTVDLTDVVADHDQRVTQHGVEVVCDQKSYLYLNGSTVDFQDEMMERKFVFLNPNASSSCGCGVSFSA